MRFLDFCYFVVIITTFCVCNQVSNSFGNIFLTCDDLCFQTIKFGQKYVLLIYFSIENIHPMKKTGIKKIPPHHDLHFSIFQKLIF